MKSYKDLFDKYIFCHINDGEMWKLSNKYYVNVQVIACHH